MIKLETIKPNPNNPRVIRDDRFVKLVNSILEFPKMMELRPMVVNSDMIVLGGNMRLKALNEIGYTEIPEEWVRSAEDLTEEEQERFIIADNVSFGGHDWSVLANEWDSEKLSDWGLDIPDVSFLSGSSDIKNIPRQNEELREDQPTAPAIEFKIVFEDIQVYDTVKIEIEELLKGYPGAEIKL